MTKSSEYADTRFAQRQNSNGQDYQPYSKLGSPSSKLGSHKRQPKNDIMSCLNGIAPAIRQPTGVSQVDQLTSRKDPELARRFNEALKEPP